MAAKRLVLYFLLFCQISGIAIFLKGFFPLKKNSPGFSTWNENGSVVASKFDRLIIIMIDALRADFIFGNNSYMRFTNQLIDNGDTYSFQAYSNPPTVTMPRIKAITTGTIPGFIDVILNVDSKELTEDNLITQMKKSNKKIIFFGDDTWIRLFPNHFSRHDGTTSFFVTDYTEVDNNVTRHVIPEMAQDDWDVMILHYLGLDHIGHLTGPSSPLVPFKLNEMDEIIQLIYKTAVEEDRDRNMSTLLMLCGDHGMSDGGSHGGSSSAETTTPLVFMTSQYQRSQGKPYKMMKVDQIDIAPTLALLFGLSIPKNSIGIVIPDLLTRHSSKERLEALRMNTLQISEVYKSNTDNEAVVDLDLAVRLHKEWLRDCENKSRNGIDLDLRSEKISKLYYSSMQVMIQKLTKFMSSYDFYALYIGIWLVVQSLLGSVCLYADFFPYDLSQFFYDYISTLSIIFLVFVSLTGCIHVHLCSTPGLATSDLFCVPSLCSFILSTIFIISSAITLLGLTFILVRAIANGLQKWILISSLINTETLTFLIFGLLLHNISLLSTSFIEEEHQTWYFLTTSYHIIVFLKIYFERRNTHSYSSVEGSSTAGNATTSKNRVTDKTRRKNLNNHVDKDADDHIWTTVVYMLILLLCNRTLRSWNQTGIKWSDQPDIGDWLLIPENKTVFSLLIMFSLLGINLNVYSRMERNRCGLIKLTIFTCGAVGVYLYRASTGSIDLILWSTRTPQTGIQYAQFVHFCLLIFVLIFLFQIFYEKRKGCLQSPEEVLVTAYLLLITLLLRPHNIPIVALMLLQVHVHRKVIWRRCKSNVEIVLSAYYIGWFTYFAQGNSNSLATVDIGAGYIGLGQNYWPVFVGLLTSLATFSGQLFWLLQAVLFIQSKCNSSNCCASNVSKVCSVLLLIKSFNVTVCTMLSWFNCYHLFVWSVFSPKLLYEAVVSLVIAAFILSLSTFFKF